MVRVLCIMRPFREVAPLTQVVERRPISRKRVKGVECPPIWAARAAAATGAKVPRPLKLGRHRDDVAIATSGGLRSFTDHTVGGQAGSTRRARRGRNPLRSERAPALGAGGVGVDIVCNQLIGVGID